MNPEVELLLQATPLQTCLKAGTSALGQQAFQVMKSSNLARLQMEDAEKVTTEQLERFKVQQLGHKQQLLENIAAYKQSVIDARIKKQLQQQNFDRFWKMQMNWTSQKKAELKNQPYNPDEVWTIEGPTRKAQDKVRRDKATNEMKSTLDTQAQFYKNNLESERSSNLKEGKRLCDQDLALKDQESQLVAFKKQMFAQEMKNAWEKQQFYKKTLQQVEDMY